MSWNDASAPIAGIAAIALYVGITSGKDILKDVTDFRKLLGVPPKIVVPLKYADGRTLQLTNSSYFPDVDLPTTNSGTAFVEVDTYTGDVKVKMVGVAVFTPPVWDPIVEPYVITSSGKIDTDALFGKGGSAPQVSPPKQDYLWNASVVPSGSKWALQNKDGSKLTQEFRSEELAQQYLADMDRLAELQHAATPIFHATPAYVQRQTDVVADTDKTRYPNEITLPEIQDFELKLNRIESGHELLKKWFPR